MRRSDAAKPRTTPDPGGAGALESDRPAPGLQGQNSRSFAEASYVKALLEVDTADLTEGAGVVRASCGSWGYVAFFDAEALGIRGSWDQRGSL